jgi:hypothetical protein
MALAQDGYSSKNTKTLKTGLILWSITSKLSKLINQRKRCPLPEAPTSTTTITALAQLLASQSSCYTDLLHWTSFHLTGQND